MDIKKEKEAIDQVSSSFCLAKWLQVTIDLVHGTNHSCHHPKRHKIPLDELAKDVGALHNTLFKKQQRKMMLEGVRPRECEYCWKIEDAGGNFVSDRYIKSSDPWAFPKLNEIKAKKWDESVNPTYVEVMFDKACNFACSYCLADISSSVASEMKQFGAYPVLKNSHRMPENTPVKLVDGVNPYIEAFWKWFPKIYSDLQVFRITGGEPLLSKHTFKVLEFLEKNPNPNLTLAINSNLGLEQKKLDTFREKIQSLLSSNCIKEFELYASVDTFGKQAEYIRKGLDFELFIRNVEYFCKDVPTSRVILMVTYSILSIPEFGKLMKLVADLKSKYSNLILDLAYLKEPEYLRANMATKDLKDIASHDLFEMQKIGNLFTKHEINKLARIVNWIHEETDSKESSLHKSDFFNFVNEYDRRYGFKFLEIFPQMREFYIECKKSKFLSAKAP